MPSAASSQRPAPSIASGPLRLISLAEACERSGFSRWWIRQSVIEGKFPRPVPTGGRSTKFVAHEVDQWINDRIAERDAGRRA